MLRKSDCPNNAEYAGEERHGAATPDNPGAGRASSYRYSWRWVTAHIFITVQNSLTDKFLLATFVHFYFGLNICFNSNGESADLLFVGFPLINLDKTKRFAFQVFYLVMKMNWLVSQSFLQSNKRQLRMMMVIRQMIGMMMTGMMMTGMTRCGLTKLRKCHVSKETFLPTETLQENVSGVF